MSLLLCASSISIVFGIPFDIFIEKIVVQYADSVVCVDQRLGQYISNSFDREPLIRPNFVMVPDPPLPVRPLESNLRFCITRRLVPKNGVFYALSALREISHYYQGVHTISVDIFGSGQLLHELREEFNDHIFTFHGDASPNLISEYLSSSHFSLVPSVPIGDYVEATSLSALEALSHSCMLIASDAGGLHDILFGSDAGILVKPGSSLSIKEAIIHLIENPSLYYKFSNNAHNHALSNYSVSRFVESVPP